jgi:hypothetical protein
MIEKPSTPGEFIAFEIGYFFVLCFSVYFPWKSIYHIWATLFLWIAITFIFAVNSPPGKIKKILLSMINLYLWLHVSSYKESINEAFYNLP